MYDSRHKKGMIYQYSCSKCNYKREGLLDHPMYSWNCPKCGGYPKTEVVKEKKNDLA